MKLKIAYFITFVIVAFSTFNKLQGILAGNFGFTFDQGRDLLAAEEILKGKIPLIGPSTGLAGLFHGPLWYWLLAVFSFICNHDPRLVLVQIVFLFLAADLILFFVVNKFYGAYPAFLTLIFLVLSPLTISLNQQLWSPSMIIFSTIVTAVAILGILNKKNWFWILGFSIGAAIQFEAAGGSFLLLSTLAAFVFLKPIKTSLKQWGVFAVSLSVTFLPQLIFELRHGFLMTQRVLGYFGRGKGDIIAEHGIKTIEYKTGLFYDVFTKSFFGTNVDMALLLLAFLFYLICLMSTRHKKFDPKIKIFVLFSFSIVFLMWVFQNLYFDVIWGHFVYSTTVFFILLVVFLLTAVRKYYPKASIFVVFLLTGIMLWPVFLNIKQGSNIAGDASYFHNEIRVVDMIYADAGKEPFNVLVYDPTTFSYQYDYILSTYAVKKYGKLPVDNESHQRLVYYIVNPDSIAERKEKWLKERNGDGNVVSEKLLFQQGKDGLILQKRIREFK